MNSEYIVTLARTFEERYGVTFSGMREGPVTDPRERLIQFKTNIDVVMSVLDKNGLGDWLTNRLVEIGDRSRIAIRSASTCHATRSSTSDCVSNLPEEPQTVTAKNRCRRGKRRSRSRCSRRRATSPAPAAPCRKSSSG
jgi:hypothetical protein